MLKENIIKNYQQPWQKQNLTNGSEKKKLQPISELQGWKIM